MSMGKPKAPNAFTNLGLSSESSPLKPKSILNFSLGPLQPHTLLLHLWRRRRRKWRRERHCRRSSELVQATNFPSRRLDYRHPRRVRRRVPTSASGSGASSCGLVSASGSGASSHGLVSASEGASSVEPGCLGESLPRGVRRRQCCCHRVPIAGGLGRVASKGGDDEGRVDGGTFTQNARCMGLAGAPQESLMLPELHPRLSICWDFGSFGARLEMGVEF